MQGLRPLHAHHDENSGLASRNNVPGKTFGAEEGRSVGLGPMKTPMPSARKALGNITNKGLDATNILHPPGKTPAAGGSVARKPLTNAFNTVAAQPADDDRISKLAQDGVERLAGKGWDELEKEREAYQDEEISEKIAAMAAFGHRSFPTYYPRWAAPSSLPPLPVFPQKEEETPMMLPSPVKQPRNRTTAAAVPSSSSSSAFFLGVFEDDFLGADDVCLPEVVDDDDDDEILL